MRISAIKDDPEELKQATVYPLPEPAALANPKTNP